jgi:hypothetical protein
MMMQELLEQFVALDAATQLAILALVAGALTKLARALGLEDAPGYQSVVASVLFGALTGFAASGWQGAVLGALAGLVATGAHQAGRQTAKRREDLLEIKRQQFRLP